MTRKFGVFAASFVVASGLFGTWTLTSSTGRKPPLSLALT
jgi:hypothetical protein